MEFLLFSVCRLQFLVNVRRMSSKLHLNLGEILE